MNGPPTDREILAVCRKIGVNPKQLGEAAAMVFERRRRVAHDQAEEPEEGELEALRSGSSRLIPARRIGGGRPEYRAALVGRAISRRQHRGEGACKRRSGGACKTPAGDGV